VFLVIDKGFTKPCHASISQICSTLTRFDSRYDDELVRQVIAHESVDWRLSRPSLFSFVHRDTTQKEMG
jgi:hypothetical protein